MRIDLPRCNFKNCRYCFDSNCTKKSEQERCEYRLAKTEAIKEFAERLETELGDLFIVAHSCVPLAIDKLVKEMTEEHNGNV